MGFQWSGTEIVRFLSKNLKEIKEELLQIRIELEKIKQKVYEEKDN